MEEKLIQTVKKSKLLYDTTHPDYMKTNLKLKIWGQIAKEIGLQSGSEAKTKWEKLRHSLRDALRRKKKCLRSVTPVTTLKPWKFEKQMAFLLHYTVKRKRESNLNDEDSTTQNYEELKCEDTQEVDSLKEESHSQPTSSSHQPTSSSRQPTSSSHQPRKKNMEDDNLQHELLSLAREHFKQTEKESQVIAKNWAFKLERMSLDQRRLAEKFINEILFEGETGTLDRNSVIINPTAESLCTCHIKRSHSPVSSIPIIVHEESLSDT